MRHFKTIALIAGLVFSFSMRAAFASASPEEIQKQNDFKKAYASSDKDDHLKAVALLEGATHESTRALLATVIQVDPYKDVQIEAYKLLSQMPARDMSLAQLMVNLFNGHKLTDAETRIAFLGAMKNSEFKYALTEAAAEFANRMRYPDPVSYRPDNTARGGLMSSDPNIGIKKTRAEFEKYLAAFNAFTKATLPAEDKNAPATLKAWVAANRNKLVNADKEVLEKYRLEDKERLDKNNPLLPNKDRKEEKKEEKKDERAGEKEKKDEEKKDLVKDAVNNEKKPEKKATKDE